MTPIPKRLTLPGPVHLSRATAEGLLAAIEARTPMPQSLVVQVGEEAVTLRSREGVDGVYFWLSKHTAQPDAGGGGEPAPLPFDGSGQESGSGEGSAASSPPSGDSPASSSSAASSPPSGDSPASSSPGSGESSGSASSKAIVQHRGRHVGWVCKERPAGDFADVIEVLLPDRESCVVSAAVPPQLRPDQVESIVLDQPAVCGARLFGDQIIITVHSLRGEPRPSVATVRVAGAHQPLRWRESDESEARRQAAFYRQAFGE